MPEMFQCPSCQKKHLTWDTRAKAWLCLTNECGYSTRVYPNLNNGEAVFELDFPTGLKISDEDDLTKMYVSDRKDAETIGNIRHLVSKWKFLCPTLANKTTIDDDVLVPPELLRISFLARKYIVPDGVIFFQLLNSGQLIIDGEGFVRNNPKKEAFK